MLQPMSPDEVLAQVAQALPLTCLDQVVIIGSLAAGWRYFSHDPGRAIRTKDVDCMLSPHAKAVVTARQVAEALLASDWKPRPGDWQQPGDATVPTHELPLIRLLPPTDRQGTQWFLELLCAPGLDHAIDAAKTFERVETRAGHFALCSFRFLALVEWHPIATPHGIRVARPEMMALANLLHHPTIDPTVIKGTSDRRSNKDLGRAVAIGWLAQSEDFRLGTAHFDTWGANMATALRSTFPAQAPELAQRASQGLQALIKSPADLTQALAIANRGLLASQDMERGTFEIMCRRLQRLLDEAFEDAFT